MEKAKKKEAVSVLSVERSYQMTHFRKLRQQVRVRRENLRFLRKMSPRTRRRSNMLFVLLSFLHAQ